MFKNITLLLGLIALVFSFYSCKQQYYIVRHAEKQPAEVAKTRQEAMDLPLSEKGEQRAMHLAKRLKQKNILHVFSTDYKRTKQTVNPVALQKNLPIQLYSPRGDSLHSVVSRIKGLKKGNVLIVGHSNTVDDLVNALSGKTLIEKDLDETVYNKLYRITFKKSKVLFKEFEY